MDQRGQLKMTDLRQEQSRSWWRHCTGLENPADLAFRGASAEALVDSKLWWGGPHWLSKDESCWPSEEQQLNEEDEFKIGTERKRKVAMAATLITG